MDDRRFADWSPEWRRVLAAMPPATRDIIYSRWIRRDFPLLR